MTLLQVKTAAPASVNATDVMSLVNQAMGFVSTALPKVIAIAYFAAVIIILWHIWKGFRGGQKLSLMEWIGVAIVFGLMRA